MELCDEIFPDEDNNLHDLELFVVIYGTVLELLALCRRRL